MADGRIDVRTIGGADIGIFGDIGIAVEQDPPAFGQAEVLIVLDRGQFACPDRGDQVRVARDIGQGPAGQRTESVEAVGRAVDPDLLDLLDHVPRTIAEDHRPAIVIANRIVGGATGQDKGVGPLPPHQVVDPARAIDGVVSGTGGEQVEAGRSRQHIVAIQIERSALRKAIGDEMGLRRRLVRTEGRAQIGVLGQVQRRIEADRPAFPGPEIAIVHRGGPGIGAEGADQVRVGRRVAQRGPGRLGKARKAQNLPAQHDLFDRGQPVVPPGTEDHGAPIDRRHAIARWNSAQIEGIGTIAAVDQVDPGATPHRIVAGTAIDRIVAAVGIDPVGPVGAAQQVVGGRSADLGDRAGRPVPQEVSNVDMPGDPDLHPAGTGRDQHPGPVVDVDRVGHLRPGIEEGIGQREIEIADLELLEGERQRLQRGEVDDRRALHEVVDQVPVSAGGLGGRTIDDAIDRTGGGTARQDVVAAPAAIERIGPAPAKQLVWGIVAGQDIGQVVAEDADRDRTQQHGIFHIGLQRVIDRGIDRVDPRTGKLGDAIAIVVDIIGIVPRAAHHHVAPGAPVQGVVARSAQEDIVARLPGDPDRAGARDQDIVTRSAGQRIAARQRDDIGRDDGAGNGDRQGPGCGRGIHDRLPAATRQSHRGCAQGRDIDPVHAGFEIGDAVPCGRRGIGQGKVAEGIASAAAGQGIGATAAAQPVVPGVSRKAIGRPGTDQHVGPVPASHLARDRSVAARLEDVGPATQVDIADDRPAIGDEIGFGTCRHRTDDHPAHLVFDDVDAAVELYRALDPPAVAEVGRDIVAADGQHRPVRRDRPRIGDPHRLVDVGVAWKEIEPDSFLIRRRTDHRDRAGVDEAIAHARARTIADHPQRIGDLAAADADHAGVGEVSGAPHAECLASGYGLDQSVVDGIRSIPADRPDQIAGRIGRAALNRADHPVVGAAFADHRGQSDFRGRAGHRDPAIVAEYGGALPGIGG